MKFLLHISASPESPFAEAAFQFADTVVTQNHELCGLFFSGRAVSTFNTQNDDSKELLKNWHVLLENLAIKALCCSSASASHLNEEVLSPFVEVAGLGQLVDLSEKADRVICFGSRD